MRAATGSQCKLMNRSVTCVLFGSLKINLAAAFWFNCRGLMELAGRPAKSYFNCNSQVWTEQEPEQGVVYSVYVLCIVYVFVYRFYDKIVANQLYMKLSFYNRFIYCRNLIYLTYGKMWLILYIVWGLASSEFLNNNWTCPNRASPEVSLQTHLCYMWGTNLMAIYHAFSPLVV